MKRREGMRLKAGAITVLAYSSQYFFLQVVLLPPGLLSFARTWDGFKDIKWGTEISTLKMERLEGE